MMLWIFGTIELLVTSNFSVSYDHLLCVVSVTHFTLLFSRILEYFYILTYSRYIRISGRCIQN